MEKTAKENLGGNIKLMKEEAENFINLENKKEQIVCERAEIFLRKHLNPGCSCGFNQYSSGKKAYFFDTWGVFVIYVFDKTNLPGFECIYFSEQEIESYAKCYRVLDSRFNPIEFSPLENGYTTEKIVKVFEFKPEKI